MGAPRKNPPPNAVALTEEFAAQGHTIIGIAKRLGVTRETFKRWCEEDEKLQEAFDIGRETERQTLHALIVQSAVLNKPANVNAFFLLKARHGYRENDSASTNVNVGVAVTRNVMIVHDHGTDEEWEARAAEHQRKLVLDAASPPASPQPAQIPSPTPAAMAYAPAQPQQAQAPHYDPSTWKANA